MRRLDPLRARLSPESLIAALAVAFLAWFSMKFHMDNANDSETNAYVGSLLSSATHARLLTDGTGHYTALAPYVMWPIAATLERLTGAYEIRGLVVALLVLGALVYGAAYAWYRCIGLGWLTSLLGLVLLSTSLNYAMLIRGWEIDKLIEPGLLLLAALAAWHQRWLGVVAIAALAAANRETGGFVVLVALAGLARQSGSLRAALTRWPVWACLIVCAIEIAWFRRFGPPSTVTIVAFEDVKIDRLVNVIGGLCLTPLLAVAWIPSAPEAFRRLFAILAPTWVVWVLATDRLEQGAVLLAPLAVLLVPATLAGVEQLVRAPREVVSSP